MNLNRHVIAKVCTSFKKTHLSYPEFGWCIVKHSQKPKENTETLFKRIGKFSQLTKSSIFCSCFLEFFVFLFTSISLGSWRDSKSSYQCLSLNLEPSATSNKKPFYQYIDSKKKNIFGTVEPGDSPKEIQHL